MNKEEAVNGGSMMIDIGSLERIYSSIGQYIDPTTGQDLTLQAAIYAVKRLDL